MTSDPSEIQPGAVDYVSRLGGASYGRVLPESLFVMRRPAP